MWLYAGLSEKLTENAKNAIEDSDLLVSQMVRLELQYLFEIGRITVNPSIILKSLSRSINLKISDFPLREVIEESLKIDWTRDVFDRMLTAEASATENKLITADEPIQANFKQAIW